MRAKDKIHAPGVDPPHPLFAGAHTAATPRTLSRCDKCKGTSFYAANFVEVDAVTYKFVYDPTSPASRVAAEIKKVTENKPDTDPDRGGRDGTVINICWQCLGTCAHNNPFHYVRNNTQTGLAHVISYFRNQRKKRYHKACNSDPEMVEGLYRAAMNKFPTFEIKLKDAMDIALANPVLNQAADWIVNIAPNVYIMYKCPQCLECPTQIRMWLRGKNNWYCPSIECHNQHGKCKKWKWGEAGNDCRVLVLPECFVEKDQAPKMTAVILGKCDKEDEATLQLLKTAKLITACWDKYGKEKVLTWRHVVAAIRLLDDKTHGNIIRSNLQINKRTAITEKEFDDMGCKRHCTHPSLSLSQWGEFYRSIHIPNDTKVLDECDRKDVLDALCLFFDWKDMQAPANKKSRAYKAWQKRTTPEHIETVKKWAQGGCISFMKSYEEKIRQKQEQA